MVPILNGNMNDAMCMGDMAVDILCQILCLTLSLHLSLLQCGTDLAHMSILCDSGIGKRPEILESLLQKMNLGFPR